VKDGPVRNSGEQTYQAEILMFYGSGVAGRVSGRDRTMTVRGPFRSDKEQAQRDADKLQAAAKDGVKVVRSMANTMKRSVVSTS